MKNAALALVLIALPIAAQAQTKPTTSTSSTDKTPAEKDSDYRSLQYGNGKITPHQNEGIKIREKALQEASDGDPTTTPSSSDRTKPTGKARPE